MSERRAGEGAGRTSYRLHASARLYAFTRRRPCTPACTPRVLFRGKCSSAKGLRGYFGRLTAHHHVNRICARLQMALTYALMLMRPHRERAKSRDHLGCLPAEAAKASRKEYA